MRPQSNFHARLQESPHMHRATIFKTRELNLPDAELSATHLSTINSQSILHAGQQTIWKQQQIRRRAICLLLYPHRRAEQQKGRLF